MSLQISNLKDLQKYCANQAARYIIPKVLEEKTFILGQIENLIFTEGFGNNETILGLLGKYAGDESKDLQAIFGLTDNLAESAVTEMAEVVRLYLSLDLKPIRGNTFSTINNATGLRLIIGTKDLERGIRQIPSATYPYSYVVHRGRELVPEFSGEIAWLEWLFDGFATEAAIDFEFDKGNSRSGRAIMSRADQSGWSWPGINFILDIINDPILREKVNLELDTVLKRIL